MSSCLYQPCPSRTHREADGNLSSPRRGAGEQDASDVRARDGQHQRDNPRQEHQEPNHWEDVAGNRRSGDEAQPFAAILRRVVALQRATNRFQFCGRVGNPHTGLQPAAEPQPPRPAAREHGRVVRDHDGRGAHRHPDIRPHDRRALKSLRCDADHDKGMPVDRQRLADDRGIRVEAPRPKAVTQHHEGARAQLFAVACADQPSGGRADAQHGKVIGRDEIAKDPFSAASATQAHRLAHGLIGVHPLQRRDALADVAIVRIRHVVEAAPAVRAADIDQPVGLDHASRRMEQQSIRHGEDGGVRANADGERERGRHGKERTALKQPHSVLEIPPRVVQPHERPGVRMELLGLFDATKRSPRGEPCVLGPQTTALQVVFEECQMRSHLSREVWLRPPGAEDGEEPEEESSQPRHGYDSSRSSLSTRPARRRQRVVCRSSAWTPVFVMA